MAKLTSGGMESGARPIWDAREGEEENCLVHEKPGRRKAGRDADGVVDVVEVSALSRPLDRAVDSILERNWWLMLGLVSSEVHFLELFGPVM